GRTAGSVTVDGTTGPIQTAFPYSAHYTVATGATRLRRVARLADIVQTAAVADPIGTETLIVVTGHALAGEATLVRALALLLCTAGRAGGAARTLHATRATEAR